jgi:hypothetical protein
MSASMCSRGDFYRVLAALRREIDRANMIKATTVQKLE